MKLSELKPGQKGRIKAVGGKGALRRHLLDMGLTPQTPVMVRKTAPSGDPIELCLRRYELTLRLSEAEKIEIDEDSLYSPCSSSCRNCRKRACGERRNSFFKRRHFWGNRNQENNSSADGDE